jgi:hypothetical protein
MDFWPTLLSTFFGAFLAFIFSIILFYITTKFGASNQKSKLERNLLNELEYNEHYLKRVLGDLQKYIEKITVDDKQLYCVFNFSQYQRLFISQYFQQGLLYEKLSPDDINQIELILSHFTQNGESWLYGHVERWKKGELPQKEALSVFSYERDQLNLYLKFITAIKNKIQFKK